MTFDHNYALVPLSVNIATFFVAKGVVELLRTITYQRFSLRRTKKLLFYRKNEMPFNWALSDTHTPCRKKSSVA